MTNFTINSACFPLSDNQIAITKTDIIFQVLSNYLVNESKPKIYFERNIEDLLLTESYSFYDYINEVLERIYNDNIDHDLAKFILDYRDNFEIISLEKKYSFEVYVENDPRFKNDISLKHVCENQNILISISENSYWYRKTINIIIKYSDNRQNLKHIIYNLYNSDCSYISWEEKKFSIHDKERFVKKSIDGHPDAYQEIGTANIWYLDRLHKDHYEVFDSKTGIHLGEASIETGKIDDTRKDLKKHL